MGLTGKQKAFVEAYCGEAKGNATEAARLAGYSSPEGSAAKNMGKGKIREAVEKRMAEVREARGALTPEECHELWARMARDLSVMPKDRLAAVRDAAKAMGMFVDRVEHSGSVEVPVTVSLPSNGRER